MSTLSFRRDGCYRIERTLELRNRSDLRLGGTLDTNLQHAHAIDLRGVHVENAPRHRDLTLDHAHGSGNR
jgi:hypothetical protein